MYFPCIVIVCVFYPVYYTKTSTKKHLYICLRIQKQVGIINNVLPLKLSNTPHTPSLSLSSFWNILVNSYQQSHWKTKKKTESPTLMCFLFSFLYYLFCSVFFSSLSLGVCAPLGGREWYFPCLCALFSCCCCCSKKNFVIHT